MKLLVRSPGRAVYYDYPIEQLQEPIMWLSRYAPLRPGPENAA